MLAQRETCDLLRLSPAMTTDNPYITQLDAMTEELLALATDERVLKRLEALPTDPEARVSAIRETMKVADLESEGLSTSPLVRVPRWFEELGPGASPPELYFIPPPPPGDGHGLPPYLPPGGGGH